MNIVSNCPLCDEHSLHILGKDETQTQQCINCGYVTAEKFKLNGLNKEEHKEYLNLTEDMKGWSKVENDRIWIPTILTLPIGMLYPDDVDNLVKFYMDAMNGIFYFDDAQIVSLHATKVYGHEDYIHIKMLPTKKYLEKQE